MSTHAVRPQWRHDVPPPIPQAAPAGPTLFVVAECGCGRQVAEVRDRDGRSVRLDLDAGGRAHRDPAGEWLAAKVGGQWRVINAGTGGPSPAGGVRYAAHRCQTGAVEALADIGAAIIAETASPAPAGDGRRPATRSNLSGPACPERASLPQAPAAGGPPFQKMCTVCGRVTARSDVDGWPWCGGEFRISAVEAAALTARA